MSGLCCHMGHGDIRAQLLPRAMSMPMVLLQLGFVMMFMAQVSTGGLRNNSILSQPYPSLTMG